MEKPEIKSRPLALNPVVFLVSIMHVVIFEVCYLCCLPVVERLPKKGHQYPWIHIVQGLVILSLSLFPVSYPFRELNAEILE